VSFLVIDRLLAGQIVDVFTCLPIFTALVIYACIVSLNSNRVVFTNVLILQQVRCIVFFLSVSQVILLNFFLFTRTAWAVSLLKRYRVCLSVCLSQGSARDSSKAVQRRAMRIVGCCKWHAGRVNFGQTVRRSNIVVLFDLSLIFCLFACLPHAGKLSSVHRERKCAENYNEWHNKFIFKLQPAFR